jgi:outer membrane receptor protein involved in Fe transport
VWRVISGGTASFDAYKSGDGVSQLRLLGNVGVDSFNQKNNILSPSGLTYEAGNELVGTSLDGTTTNLNFNVGTGLLYTYTPKHGRWRNALSGGVTYESVDLSSVYVTARNLTAGQPNVDSGALTVAQTRLRTKESGLYLQDEVALLNDRLSLLGGLLGERSSLNGDTGKYFVYPKLAAVYSLLPSSKDGAGMEGSPFARFEVLRVRGAYGEAGNRPNYGNKFTPLTALSIDGNAGIVLGGASGDPTLEPERQREFELGADAALKDQKVVAELTFYRRAISNLILQRALAPSTGFTTAFRNGGNMRNLGVELALQVMPVSRKGLEWTTRGILTLNRSKITDLPDDVPAFNNPGTGFGGALGVFRLQEGKSATQIVGAADNDGDGEDDVVGNGEPDFRIGWSNVIQAGDFTISTLIDWQQGSDIINLTRYLYDYAQNSPDVAAAAERFATADGGDISPYVEDATFVKVREISVAYTLPKQLAAQLGPVKTLTLSASGRNLLTFSNYSGLDPEVSNFGNQSIGRNYDVAPYPPSRSFWFSVSAGL